MVCPNPETLAATVEGRVDPAERDAVLNHAALCDDCRHALLILRTLAPSRSHPVLRFRPWMPWAAAAVFIFSVAALLRAGREQTPATPPLPTTRVTPPKETERPPAPKPPPPVVPRPEEPKPTPAPTIIVDPPPAPAPRPAPEPPVKPEEPAPVKPAPTPEPPRPTTVAIVATLERMEGEVL